MNPISFYRVASIASPVSSPRSFFQAAGLSLLICVGIVIGFSLST